MAERPQSACISSIFMVTTDIFGRIAENAKNNAVRQTALAAVCFLSAAGTASDNYLPISSDGRNSDRVSGL
jgi:hypothetical protein